MQIDGHHTATYVAARAAGFPHHEAEKVAYAAQYVDDATNAGAIYFHDSEYMYARIASAHKMLDYHNLVELANHLVWIPFHFLPGNDGLAAGEEPQGGEKAKLVCKPDSPVARDMLRSAMQDRNSARGLHRLGIAMHVYADTFAHQGFVGLMHEANSVANLRSDDPETDERIRNETTRELFQRIRGNVRGWLQMAVKAVQMMIIERKSPFKYINEFINSEPLGHAAANTYPDQPYLVWYYEGHDGSTVIRDNPDSFVQAVEMMTRAMRAWRVGDESMTLEEHDGLGEEDRAVVERLFCEHTDPDGEVRHVQWLKAIADGEFSFGAQELFYVSKGAGSWKHSALGTTRYKDSGVEQYPYIPAFLDSDWKLFHDAIQVHRTDVVHGILPRYGICAA